MNGHPHRISMEVKERSDPDSTLSRPEVDPEEEAEEAAEEAEDLLIADLHCLHLQGEVKGGRMVVEMEKVAAASLSSSGGRKVWKGEEWEFNPITLRVIGHRRPQVKIFNCYSVVDHLWAIEDFTCDLIVFHCDGVHSILL